MLKFKIKKALIDEGGKEAVNRKHKLSTNRDAIHYIGTQMNIDW